MEAYQAPQSAPTLAERGCVCLSVTVAATSDTSPNHTTDLGTCDACLPGAGRACVAEVNIEAPQHEPPRPEKLLG